MGNVEIPKWLNDLPLAPEFHPTDTEFADPIAYISKIEKQASAFGICKIIPPLPKPSKKYVFYNLNKSLSKSPEVVDGVDLSSPCSSLKVGSRENASDGEARAVFTTRHQELGLGMKKTKGMVKENPQLSVHKQVWQSGEVYTLEQFESKSKAFARSLLGPIKEINALVVEALFWRAASEKPIQVEYANDVPGSGFGEPQGQFQYFHRRRRKRASYKSFRQSKENSDCVTVGLDSVNNSSNEGAKGIGTKNELSMSTETIPHASITSTSYTEETLRSSNSGNDMEGTAGWKLSNSPWNLQVIARSPGSLTRFMPDDIPGVTSPMVYIGMLFSWFAWHVEDHELHSMNFLHTGSPKTWYSVPGDYAFTFEEVIRSEAYGGSIDRLAALSMLGEKTTLLSPETVVSSGIPCCRLVQNPGDFVVTFPRAYHVGFSHGFNCGEAANFATPQWLKVAKEAAVRRAAMNYLPMLSHQQLLYLLTMSFVSRVPRSFLPGARSSRLRDRLKEERELSVKKAFIEDILRENSILSVILSKESDSGVVIWNPDLLPCASKESQLPSTISSMTENVLHTHSEDNSNTTGNDLFKEMSFYMETLNDLYMDNDDLSCDFQVDSGTLVCAACGILGFPFMSVVQPCDGASTEIFAVDHPLVQEGYGAEKPENCHSSAIPDGSIRCSIPDLEVPTGWNNSNKFLRPRIFCLEHGLQIKELLRSKGGANRRIICHSDYQKIKAHAVSIAEEIGIPFQYKEAPLNTASQEDLNLIYLALDGENRAQCGEDWTSKMGINLRYCVKVRKNSPSNKVHHALALGGLFSDGTTSDFLNIKWQSRKSRSRIKINQPAQNNRLDAVEETKDDVLGKKSDVVIEKEERLIQYTRRKYKPKMDCSSTWSEGHTREIMEQEVSVTSCGDLIKPTGKTPKINPSNSGIWGSDSVGMSPVLHDIQAIEATGDMNLNSEPSHITASLLTPTIGVNQTLEESNSNGNICNLAASCSFNTQQEDTVGTGVNGNCNVNVTECSGPCVSEDDGMSEMQRGCQIIEDISLVGKDDALMNAVGNPAKLFTLHVSGAPREQMDNEVAEKSCTNNEVSACVAVANEVNLELQNGNESNNLFASKRSTEYLQEISAAEDKSQHEAESNREEVVVDNVRLVNHPHHISADGCSGISRELCAVGDSCYDDTSNDGVLPAIQATTERQEESVPCSAMQMEIDPSEDELCTGTTLDFQIEERLVATNRSNVEEPASYSSTQMQDPVARITVEGCSEIRAADDLSLGLENIDVEELKEIYSDYGLSMNNEANKICQATSANNVKECPFKRCSGNEDELCAVENSVESVVVDPRSSRKGSKRKNELEQLTDDNLDSNAFIRSPCEGLRPRAAKDATCRTAVDVKKPIEENPVTKKARKLPDASAVCTKKTGSTKRSHKCDIEGCRMSFSTKAELQLHKRNRCPIEGCRKRFTSHKYATIHQRVHEDDRPLKCPWKGCSMSFKWAWARTEHIRVHTGEKPYKCKVEGCGLSFRFVSDYSRHRRKTGHYVNTDA
ncbi:lysine-specific demethylase ELF6 [Euphorbia lathyris]|uniref:lysine-specific demethylase ELF6 n=1 Tax=Euphorbia lathyris TaxID=212925 RepID=UPI0033141B2F